jgi:adenylate cyclase
MPDRQAVPVDPAMAGVEIHATFVDNALRGAFMREMPSALSQAAALLMVLSAAVLPLFGRRALRRWFVPGLLTVWAGIPLLGHAAFRYGIWLDTLAGFVPASVSLVTALALAYRAEGRQRAYLKKAFAQDRKSTRLNIRPG